MLKRQTLKHRGLEVCREACDRLEGKSEGAARGKEKGRWRNTASVERSKYGVIKTSFHPVGNVMAID